MPAPVLPHPELRARVVAQRTQPGGLYRDFDFDTVPTASRWAPTTTPHCPARWPLVNRCSRMRR